MKELIFSESAIWSNTMFLLRCWVGIIFIRYGLSMWHQSNMDSFADTLQTVHIPFPVLSAWLCKTTEFFGGTFLVLGFFKRPACLLLVIDMIVATFVFHKGLVLQNGMTTFLLFVCCLTLLLSSPDKLSVDWFIHKGLNPKQHP